MKTYTLYTCAGQLQLHQGRKGVQVPVVVLNRREQVMEPPLEPPVLAFPGSGTAPAGF